MKARLQSIFFLIALGGIAIANLFQLGKAAGVLDRESRKLVPWPVLSASELASGNYTKHIEDAFADRFLGRADALDAANWLASLKGLPSRTAELIQGKAGDIYAAESFDKAAMPSPGALIAMSSAGSSAFPSDGSYSISQNTQSLDTNESGWVNSFLIVDKRAYETAGYSEKAAKYYAQTIEALAAKLDPSVSVYDILVPSAIEFLADERYKDVSYPQSVGISNIYQKFSVRVKCIDVYSELKAHSGEYIYHRTDHHWTALGAWYAYDEASSVLGFTSYPYNSYPKESIPGFRGTLYNATESKVLYDNPDTVELVYPFMDHVFTMRGGKEPIQGKAVDKAYIFGFNKYLSYINGDYPISDISSAVVNGKKILIIKDSYANAFIPYLIPHYEKIFIIDPRYWDGSIVEFAKENGITDLLVFNYYLVVSVYSGFTYNLERVTG